MFTYLFHTQLPDNLSFDQGSTIPLTLATAALGLYNTKANKGIELFPPWEEGGRNKYAGQPFFAYGGSSSVGQHSERNAAKRS